MSKKESGESRPLEAQMPLRELGSRAEDLIKRYKTAFGPFLLEFPKEFPGSAKEGSRSRHRYIYNTVDQLPNRDGGFDSGFYAEDLFNDGQHNFLELIGLAITEGRGIGKFSNALIHYMKYRYLENGDLEAVEVLNNSELAVQRVESFLENFNSAAAVPSKP